jgi:phosphohistidine swiveling domain-containing protein
LWKIYLLLLGVYSLWGHALHFRAGYTNQQVEMASKVQKPAVATTPQVTPFFAAAMKRRLAIHTCDGCETRAAAVVKMEEGANMIYSLGGAQAARNPLRTADRGYIL